MEKRRNTLDRWQRLRFGRRSASNPPEDKKESNADLDTSAKRSSDKTERLRELTELLKGNRQSNSLNVGQTQSKVEIPPVPPPRKPRQLPSNNNSSVEKFIDTSASESGSPIASRKLVQPESSVQPANLEGNSIFHVPSFLNTPSPSADVPNLEFLQTPERDDSVKDKRLPMAQDNSLFKTTIPASQMAAVTAENVESLPRAESRTIVGSYTQKSIPFRSASFSQVDYSSGKYIRSALGALKASLTKVKIPSVVENANITLPRRKDKSRSVSPNPSSEPAVNPPPAPPLPPYNIWIPLKPQSDKMSLNLTKTSSDNVIMEEDNENSPAADSKESKFPALNNANRVDPMNIKQAAEMTIEATAEEECGLPSLNDILQTATTCLIPVPVYECAVRDWVDSHLADEWINACEIDSAKIVEEGSENAFMMTEPNTENEIPAFSLIQNSRDSKNEGNHEPKCTSPDILIENADSQLGPEVDLPNEYQAKTESISLNEETTLDLDDVPAIAVTPGSSVSGSFDEGFKIGDESKSNLNVQSGGCPDYVVEIRKRHSNDDKNGESRTSDNTSSTSGSDASSPKSLEEKRRIDKSKRRKGIYIQWAALDKHNKELSAISWNENSSQENSANILDESQHIWPADFDNPKSTGIDGESATNYRNRELLDTIVSAKSMDQMSNTTDELQTPGSQSRLFELATPDSEYSRPQWPKDDGASRRESFSMQSSEEKDESPAASSPPTKPHNKLFVLRSDSISDNELSDRTPPPRDRTSQSPAPGEQDFKRYSKRPLRGPYGQMLEAEMKKPAKLNYDGLLEELNRSERFVVKSHLVGAILRILILFTFPLQSLHVLRAKSRLESPII